MNLKGIGKKERERERGRKKVSCIDYRNMSTNYKVAQVLGRSISKAITGNRSPLVKLEEANGDCRPENTIFRQSGFLEDGRQSSTT